MSDTSTQDEYMPDQEKNLAKLPRQRDLNPIQWYVFLTGVALLLSLLITGIIWTGGLIINTFVLDEDNQFTISTGMLFTIGGVSLLLFIFPETDGGFKVPGTRNATLATWLGIPLSLVLNSGEYKWTGKRLGFGRAEVVFGPDKGDFTDENGFAKAGPITFSVWNTGHSTESHRSTIIAPAHNRANISATLTIILQIVNLRRLLDQTDPAQDIGDRARQEFREFVNSFVDTDIPSLANVAIHVLNGTKLVSCFLPEAVGVYKAGSMIRDHGGRAMFKLIPQNKSPEVEAEYVEEFANDVLANAHPTLLEHVLKDGEASGTREVLIKKIQVKQPIIEVINEVGMRLKRTTMADVVFSDPVTAAANQASAEADERVSQIASAKTNKAARQEMLPSKEELENPAWETAMLIQAAQDDKNESIRIVVVPNGDKLTKAAVAGASQIGGK